MKSIVSILIWLSAVLFLQACSTTPSMPKYSCWQLEGEPEWLPAKLDIETSRELTAIVEGRYNNPNSHDAFINDGDTPRKYNWYVSEVGAYLACVVENSFGYKVKLVHNNACFVDRFMLKKNNGSFKLTVAGESILCT